MGVQGFGDMCWGRLWESKGEVVRGKWGRRRVPEAGFDPDGYWGKEDGEEAEEDVAGAHFFGGDECKVGYEAGVGGLGPWGLEVSCRVSGEKRWMRLVLLPCELARRRARLYVFQVYIS